MRDEDAEFVAVFEECARRSGPADTGGSSAESGKVSMHVTERTYAT